MGLRGNNITNVLASKLYAMIYGFVIKTILKLIIEYFKIIYINNFLYGFKIILQLSN